MRKKKKKCYQSKSSKDDVILPTDFDLCNSIKRKEKKILMKLEQTSPRYWFGGTEVGFSKEDGVPS